MSSLKSLNAFISERLTAAAVEIVEAVEKTLIEYRGEISRFQEEIDHLRSLLLCPRAKSHGSDWFSPHCSDKVSSEGRHEKEWISDLSPDHTGTQHIKEEDDQTADWPGLSCRQQRDGTMSPHKEPSSHLYRILTVAQTSDIKANPDGDEFPKSTHNMEISYGINPSRPLREIDQLEFTHEEDELDEQQYTEQKWSPCQDHKDRDPTRMTVETSRCVEKRNNYELPHQSEGIVRDGHHPLNSSPNQILNKQTFWTAEKKKKYAEGDSCQLFRVSPENTEDGEKRRCMKLRSPTLKKRPNSNSCSEGSDNTGVEERKHSCPICEKRFKESSHLKDHMRIHTGEKPYRCRECGMNFRQNGALTLHMRIHTGERPFQCNNCGRRFSRKGDMENHRMIHSGERPHLCVVCGKSFKRKSNLNTHLKIHAGIDYTQPL